MKKQRLILTFAGLTLSGALIAAQPEIGRAHV
mgnify:CR=1 FL=1